jgi:hypothetical protein
VEDYGLSDKRIGKQIATNKVGKFCLNKGGKYDFISENDMPPIVIDKRRIKNEGSMFTRELTAWR